MHELQITFRISAGHRIPHHAGKCQNPHGHTYGIKINITGPLQPTNGQSDGGMVVDFQVLKDRFGRWIYDHLDHGMIIWKDDTELLRAYKQTTWKHYIMETVPTAENIAKHLTKTFGQIIHDSAELSGTKIKKITVYESLDTASSFTPIA